MHKTSKWELQNTLEDFALPKDKTYMIHSSLYSFGLFEDGCSGIMEVLYSVLGREATIIMPTFTFSFTRKKNWCYRTSKSETGALTEFFRNDAKTHRTLHPIHSVAVKGPEQSKYASCSNISSFGANNPFEKLIADDAINIGLGVGLVGGATFLHYAEEYARVPYRFMKDYPGIVLDKCGSTINLVFQMYSRKTSSKSVFINDWSSISRDFRKKNLLKSKSIGLGEVMVMNMANCHELLMTKLSENPYYIANEVVKRKT